MPRPSLPRPLRPLVAGTAIGDIAGVFVLKAGIIACNFGLILLAARLLPTAEFGLYSMVFSAVGVASVLAMGGQQMLIMRTWSQYSADDAVRQLKGSLVFSGVITAAGAVLVALAFLVWLGLARDWPLAAAAAAFVAGQTVVMVSAHLLRSSVSVPQGDGHANITAVLFPIAYLAICAGLGREPTVAGIFGFYAAGAATAIAVHAVVFRRVFRARVPAETASRFEGREWRQRSFRLWLSSTLEASNQYLDVLLIGVLLSPSLAGAYFVITRLANIFATAADAINMFSTRRIPDLFFRDDRAGLDRLLNTIYAVIALVVVCGLLAIVVAGGWVLSLFNADYAPYYPALIIVAVGTAGVACAGPAPSVLMLTGHEGRYLRVLAMAIAIRAVGFVALVPLLDIYGAVIATAISYLFMAVGISHSTRQHAGLNCSVLRLGGMSWKMP